MSIFDKAERLAGKAVDRVHGQRFRLTPMTATQNTRRSRDSGRPVVDGVGVFAIDTNPTGLQLGRRRLDQQANDLHTLVTAATPSLSVDRNQFVEGALPRQGDLVQVFDEPGDPTFNVTSVQPDGHSRVALKLVKA